MTAICPAKRNRFASREAATEDAAEKNRRNARPGMTAISILCGHKACRQWHVKWTKYVPGDLRKNREAK